MTLQDGQSATIRELRTNMNTLREDVIFAQRHFADLKEEVRLMRYSLQQVQNKIDDMEDMLIEPKEISE